MKREGSLIFLRRLLIFVFVMLLTLLWVGPLGTTLGNKEIFYKRGN